MRAALAENRLRLEAQMILPFTDDGHAKPHYELLLRMLDPEGNTIGPDRFLSAALRYENYSDFGSTTNPKFGITYKPFKGLSLKGTYGTSFRAPTFTEVSQIAGGAGLYTDLPFGRILADITAGRQHVSNQYDAIGRNFGLAMFGIEDQKDLML